MRKDCRNQHIVALTGAGISAESGLSTFRDADGLWERYPIEEVATPDAWRTDPQKVLAFYNLRRRQVRQARPNAAHYALAELARHFRVGIVTQNIDDLHERAGSRNVLHLHGEIMKARSTVDPSFIVDLGEKDIALGDRCPEGGQLRPHVVWFYEDVPEFPKAARLVESADLLLVVGTSLAVYPAASLTAYTQPKVPIVIIAPELEAVPAGIVWFREKAAVKLPELVRKWIEEGIEAHI
ncbi:MAG: SIR2 family NAD-dependent protein deacylase [Gammaproteobacteria bacterium]